MREAIWPRVIAQVEAVTPFIVVGFLASLVAYLRVHFLREDFCFLKLFSGIVLDLFLAWILANIGLAIGLGEYGIYALVAVGVTRGDKWVFDLLDSKLKNHTDEFSSK